jgi:hypothetical protein
MCLPRRYGNYSEMGEYNIISKLLIQNPISIRMLSIEVMLIPVKIRNTIYLGFFVPKFKMKIKDATDVKNDDFCEYGVSSVDEILCPMAETETDFNTSNVFSCDDNEYNQNKLSTQTIKMKINDSR